MSATVLRRVVALETAAMDDSKSICAIVVELVTPGQAAANAWRIEINGQVYRSAEGESQDAFISRVTVVARELHGAGKPIVILRSGDADL